MFEVPPPVRPVVVPDPSPPKLAASVLEPVLKLLEKLEKLPLLLLAPDPLPPLEPPLLPPVEPPVEPLLPPVEPPIVWAKLLEVIPSKAIAADKKMIRRMIEAPFIPNIIPDGRPRGATDFGSQSYFIG